MTVSSMLRIIRVPLLAILAIASGSFAGWYVWPVIAGHAIAGLGGTYRGFPSILFQFCACVGAALGGATGFVLVVSGSRWRQIAGWTISVAAVAALAWSTPVAWDCSQCDGRRLALAVYGFPMLWTCVLGAFGCRMVLRPGGHAPPDKTRQPTGAQKRRRLLSVKASGSTRSLKSPDYELRGGEIYCFHDVGRQCYRFAKVLAAYPGDGVTFVRTYKQRFASPPRGVDTNLLSVGAMDDPLGPTIGCAPIAYDATFRDWNESPDYGIAPLTDEELATVEQIIRLMRED